MDLPNLRAAIERGDTTEALRLLAAYEQRARTSHADLMQRAERAEAQLADARRQLATGRRTVLEEAAAVARSWQTPQGDEIASEIDALDPAAVKP